MKIKEEISDIITKLEEMNYDGEQSTRLLVELFKKYALEMVGENLDAKDMFYGKSEIEHGLETAANITKQEIRERIEEATE